MAEENKAQEVKEQETKMEKVLILHGWEDSSQKGFIPELVKTLKDKGYSPFAYDQPDTASPKFKEWFEFAEKKIKEIGEDNLNIVGHSMGGLLALKLAEKYKVKKLILVAPVGSKPSEEYYKKTTEDLDQQDKETFKKYQDRDVDVEKVKENSKEIKFIFGEKDPWITEEIRNFYTEKFKDVAEIKVFEKYAHMSESEGVKKLPELENFFENSKSDSKPDENKEKVQEQKPADSAEKKAESEVADKKEETAETKKEEKPKKKEEKKIPKKEEAVARGAGLHLSKKHGVYICSFIKNKAIDAAISDLEEVKKFKKAVPFKGEIPHRAGKGMMSGRYPTKGAALFISILKGLKGNVIVNGMDLEKTKIYYASTSWARRPMRSSRRQGKRANVILKAKEFTGGKK